MSPHDIDNSQRPKAPAHRPCLQIRFARAVAVAAGASLLLGSVITPAQAAAPDRPGPQPKDPPPSELIFVHGYGSAATGKTCNKDREVDGTTQEGTWANALEYYEKHGDMARSSMTTVGYYEGDVNCDETIGQFTNEAPIQDIAKELAIFIDSRDDQRPVNVVAHSMGGLVTRVALLGAAHGWWPEEVGKHELNVSNVVTLSTPHQGLTEERYENEENKTRQWRQMKPAMDEEPESEFLQRLHLPHRALSEDWAADTDWSFVGSDGDDTVGYESGVDEGRHADQKYRYTPTLDTCDGEPTDSSPGHKRVRTDRFGEHCLSYWHASPDHDPHETAIGWSPLKTAFQAVTHNDGDGLPR
ncbi:MAG TPA: hypothetical protein VK053_13335 [Jiangellaceae bacterium]|nr:hypothetical protein [Jiangellaceae bacterium]